MRCWPRRRYSAARANAARFPHLEAPDAGVVRRSHAPRPVPALPEGADGHAAAARPAVGRLDAVRLRQRETGAARPPGVQLGGVAATLGARAVADLLRSAAARAAARADHAGLH